MCNQPDRKKEIAILSSVALLFFVGYYYICMMPVDVSREIRIVSSSALMGVCLFGSFFLLADSRRLRAHRVFALQMLLTGLAAGFSVARILVQSHTTPIQPLSPGILMYGNAYAFIMLLHPFELLYPKQMTVGKYFRLFLPALLTGLAYYGYSTVTGYRPGESGDWWDLLINIRDFGVWLRIALLLYPFWLFGLILRQWKRYIIWCRRNFSNTNYTELSWLNYYLFGYFLILISYMIVVTACNSQSLLSHSLCFLMFVGFTLYRILRQGAPDLPELIENTPPHEWAKSGFQLDAKSLGYESTDTADDKYRFVDKMPEYKVMLEQWMQCNKPYLNKDFKLLDVMQVLPLNRSYLSRMFNEAYGETFFSFVMRYRIEESARMLEARPDLTVARIAEICGFSSPSVFGRAFLKNMGITPKEYRNKRIPSIEARSI